MIIKKEVEMYIAVSQRRKIKPSTVEQKHKDPAEHFMR
jgi:hypothetical protein